MENFGLKDALKSGISAEQMLEDFQKQLAVAQREVAIEQETASSEVDEAREEMVDAIIEYAQVVGLAPANIIDAEEMKEDLTNAIKDAERELAATKLLLDLLCRMKGSGEVKKVNNDPDFTLREFLKSLN